MSASTRPPRRARRHLDWRRSLSLLVVVLAAAGLLAAGAASPSPAGSTAAALPAATLMPSVDLASSGATVWNCPGPLAVGPGTGSSISITNPGPRRATAAILVAETELTASQPSTRRLRSRTLTVTVDAHSERDLAIPVEPPPSNGSSKKPSSASKHRPSAPVIEAAASVTVSGSGVAVAETTTSGGQALATPCALGSSSRGFVASGSTIGSSDSEVAVFNPAVTPAVVNVRVGTEAAPVEPMAYQGVVVPPKSLAVFDLAKYVPQRTRVAVAVNATAGRIVVGSLSVVSAEVQTKLLGPGHSYAEEGASLAVGVGRPLDRWVMPLGPLASSQAEAVRLFDPGPRPAVVTLRTDTSGSRPATLTVTVPAGATATTSVPIVTGAAASSAAASAEGAAPPSSSQASTSGQSTGSTKGSRSIDGVLTVTTADGVGVVAARRVYEALPHGRVGLVASAPSSAPANNWIASGAADASALGEQLVVTNATGRPRTARVLELPAPGPETAKGTPPWRTTLQLGPWQSAVVPLKTVTGGYPRSRFGLEVSTDGPVLVTTEYQPTGGLPAIGPGVPAL